MTPNHHSSLINTHITYYLKGTGAENQRLELVNRVDAIVCEWHSGTIEAPDAGLGSDEARATRALVFFDWLYVLCSMFSLPFLVCDVAISRLDLLLPACIVRHRMA
jgi:hypothetical protein